MGTAINGSPNNRLRVTTKVLLKRSGASGFEDVGNILEFKDNKVLETVAHKSASVAGVLVQDDEQLHTVGSKFEFKLDEHSLANIRRILMAEAPSSANQSSNATLAVSISSVTKGLTYYVGGRGITSHALTFGGSAKTEGTDFTLDKKAGLVTILSGGSISNGDAVAGTIAVPAITINSWTQDKEVDLQVAFRIEQYDYAGWRCTWSGTAGRFRMMNLGDRNPTAFNEPQAVLIPMGDVTFVEREDAS